MRIEAASARCSRSLPPCGRWAGRPGEPDAFAERNAPTDCNGDACTDTGGNLDTHAEPNSNALADGHRRTGADIDANTSTGGRHTRSW